MEVSLLFKRTAASLPSDNIILKVNKLLALNGTDC